MHQEKEIVLTQLPSNQNEINRKRKIILILIGVSLVSIRKKKLFIEYCLFLRVFVF